MRGEKKIDVSMQIAVLNDRNRTSLNASHGLLHMD